MMKISEIRTYPMSCVGCLLCQLICSFTYEKVFNPSKARIVIEPINGGAKIGFTEDCTRCGKCAEYCIYGVLEKVEEEV
jgi:Fe-S-cluster-containing hydrogenase component 2